MKTHLIGIIFFFALAPAFLTSCSSNPEDNNDIVLNGVWKYGYGRNYQSEGMVPGIHIATEKPAEDTLWYKKTVRLPEGDWNRAVLELKGARFRPSVYVNGVLTSSQEGGMIRSFHELENPGLKPGENIELEIALASLSDVPVEDASYIPVADQWRSSCASCLWDDVILHLYKDARVDRVIPFVDCGNHMLKLKYRVLGAGAARAIVAVSRGSETLVSLEGPAVEGESEMEFNYAGVLKEWTPETPECYELSVTLLDAQGNVDHCYRQTLGLKDLKIAGKQFCLNDHPFKLHGGSIVWHRWMRDPEGREVGWDADWIESNIVRRLKDHGANGLRFHLGVPPERILDLCDRYGLAVQYEWSFFHGMPACGRSLVEQYSKWLDMAMRHPSVCFFHPYNETEGTQLDTVWNALNTILPSYPQLLFEERDIIHVHKYWWSLFENLGLYYDSASQFDKAIMVDEFGGNYLDGKGEMGLYPNIKESLMRFLGPNHDAAMRYYHQNRSCAKVAEYWRRIGAAGVSPFVIASSQEDGCTWFMGALKEGKPKPVWNALTVLWSPRAASMDLWDCDFVPSQEVKIPVHYFNDTAEKVRMSAVTVIYDSKGRVVEEKRSGAQVEAFGTQIVEVKVTMPQKEGPYLVRTELIERPANVKYPVRSEWNVRVVSARLPSKLKGRKIYIPECERELLAMAERFKLELCELEGADIALCGKESWPLSESLSVQLGEATKRGCNVVLLDVGDRGLGIGYPEDGHQLGNLQGITRLSNATVNTYPLFRSISVMSKELPESESHIHPVSGGSQALWKGYGPSITQLWNGLRGGLVVPSFDMLPQGLSSEAFLKGWVACGADESRIKGSEPYFAYDLCGYYAFASGPDDSGVKKELRRRVQFLIDDAPALANALNAKAPVRVTDLKNGYLKSLDGEASSLEALACAGKNLTRVPVVKIGFSANEGCVILSQLLTAGRLDPSSVAEGYAIRYDEAAVQLVLNMLAASLPE